MPPAAQRHRRGDRHAPRGQRGRGRSPRLIARPDRRGHNRKRSLETDRARAIGSRQFRAEVDVAADGGGGDDHRADQPAGHLALRQRQQSDHDRRTEGREPGQSRAAEDQWRRRHGAFGVSASLIRSELVPVQRRPELVFGAGSRASHPSTAARSDHAPDPANPPNRDTRQKRPNRSER